MLHGLIKEFRAKTVPRHVREASEAEFLRLKQGNMSVADYEAKFRELEAYSPTIQFYERWQAQKFVDGL